MGRSHFLTMGTLQAGDEEEWNTLNFKEKEV